MTHSADPVPYLLYRSDKNLHNGAKSFDEEQAEKTGIYEPNGYKLMSKMIRG
jgi:2,3-bisphosphoglycerate-independent phosphoglycerate mutase